MVLLIPTHISSPLFPLPWPDVCSKGYLPEHHGVRGECLVCASCRSSLALVGSHPVAGWMSNSVSNACIINGHCLCHVSSCNISHLRELSKLILAFLQSTGLWQPWVPHSRTGGHLDFLWSTCRHRELEEMVQCFPQVVSAYTDHAFTSTLSRGSKPLHSHFLPDFLITGAPSLPRNPCHSGVKSISVLSPLFFN